MRTIERVVAGTAGLAAAAVLAGCGIPSTGTPVSHTPPTITQAGISDDITTTTRPAPVPGSGNGTWLVPSQIQPGTYQANENGSISGYVEVCADLQCDIDMDGDDHTGIIKNYNVDGPTYVTVPSYAVSVKTQRCTLTKVG
jgi:hypothetical protein